MAGLSKQSSMSWAVTGSVGRMAAQLLAQMALARLLMPADFGTFATMLLIVTLSGYLSELGGVAQLVRQASIDKIDIGTQIVAQIGIGLLVFIVVASVAVPVTAFFNSPDAWPMMMVVGVNPLLVSLGAVANRLLSREHQFRAVQLINLGSYVVGYAGVGVTLAVLGFGVWALVLGTLAQSLLSSIAYIQRAKHSWALRFNTGRFRTQAGLGIQAFFSGLLTWGLFSFDRLFVGRLFPLEVTGAYVSAFNLSAAPVWQITSSVQQQLFAKGSKLTAQPSELMQHYENSTIFVVLAVLPVLLGVSLFSDEIVNLVLGPRWYSSAAILAVLSLAMPFYVLYSISTPYLWAMARIDLDVGIQLVTLVILFLSIALASGADIERVTWMVVSAYIIRSVFGAAVTVRILGGGRAQVFALLVRLACGLIPAMFCVLLIRFGYPQPSITGKFMLLLGTVGLSWLACATTADLNTRTRTRALLYSTPRLLTAITGRGHQ